MEFLGVGPLELIFIILIALVLLGPADMLKAAQTTGRILRTLFTSEGWREIQRSMSTLRNLPTSMMREAGLEEDIRTISDAAQVQIPRIEFPTDIPSIGGDIDAPDRPSQETNQPVLIETPPHPPDDIPPDDGLHQADDEGSIVPPPANDISEE